MQCLRPGCRSGDLQPERASETGEVGGVRLHPVELGPPPLLVPPSSVLPRAITPLVCTPVGGSDYRTAGGPTGQGSGQCRSSRTEDTVASGPEPGDGSALCPLTLVQNPERSSELDYLRSYEGTFVQVGGRITCF